MSGVMSVLSHWLANLEPTAGTVMLWAAGAIAAVVVVVGVKAFGGSISLALRRQPAPSDVPRARLKAGSALGWAAVLIGAIALWALFDRLAGQDQAAARRALDARAAELTMQAIAPGSALACLDAVANPTLESACEKALFASPEATAAAIAYVDARLTLLADGLAFAAHDRGYAPSLERLRRAVETDRFGVVAHVLATRGCSLGDCPAFKLMRDSSRVAANLKERTFDANVVLHAADWRPEGGAPPAPAAVAAVTAPAPPLPQATTGTAHPMSSKYDFPSAASIPPVSIMNAEPATPEPKGEQKAAPSAAKPPAQHRQSAREPTDKEHPPKEAQKEQAAKEPPAGAPTSIAPPSALPGTLFNPR